VPKTLPLEIASVSNTNLLSALELVRGCLKTTSMLWMHALGIPVLSGIVVDDWSKPAASAVQRFCRTRRFSHLLLRIDKKNERWSRRRGGFLIPLSTLPSTVKELRREGRIAVLLEPASPYADQYSMAGVTVPEQRRMVVEVVGPGFDASDILRGDIQAHERWQLGLDLARRRPTNDDSSRPERIFLTTPEKYAETVQLRLAKIGARTRNPAFPDVVMTSDAANLPELANEGTAFLKRTRQTALLKHADAYSPIPEKHLISFGRQVEKLLSGLAGYGIHLGSSSFAASLLPKRGLVFWDFFPAQKREAALLYPEPNQ
jgi:hypothetical protein